MGVVVVVGGWWWREGVGGGEIVQGLRSLARLRLTLAQSTFFYCTNLT